MNDPLVQNQGSVEKQVNVANNSGPINVGSNNTQQIQAGQIHIHQGINSDEVRALCLDLVQKEIALYKQQAAEESQRRFESLMDKFLDLLSKIDESKRQKLQEPAIQFAVNETFKEYIKSGEEELGDGLLDLMIERMEVDEHTTKQSLIDEARQILPKLSANTISLISIITFSELLIPRSNYDFVELLHNLSPLISRLRSVNSIDVAYLEQVGCGQSFSFFNTGKTFEQRMLSIYNLLFLHPYTIEQYNTFMTQHGYNQGEMSFVARTIMSLMEIKGQKMQFKINAYREELFLEEKRQEMIDAMTLLFKDMTQFSEDEVKQFFVEIDANWVVVSELFKRGDVKNFILSPVGLYIGSRKLSKLFGKDIPLSIFYKD